MPKSSARLIVAMDSWSSCGPQLDSHCPPPIAQAPRPTGVICIPVLPNCFFCILFSFSHAKHVTLLSQNCFVSRFLVSLSVSHRVDENLAPYRLIISLLSVNQYSVSC